MSNGSVFHEPVIARAPHRFPSLVFVALLLALGAAARAEQTAVHYKTLQEALPGELSGFKRGKPTGSTSKAMGMATSEASVQYAQGPVSITAKVADLTGVPFMGVALAAMPMMDSESETDNGYQKTVTLRNRYKAIEDVKTGGSKSCSLTFPVAGRFTVELTGSGTSDVKLLHTLADGMALDKLETAAAAK